MAEFLENLIYRHSFDAGELINAHPPQLYHPNKKLVDRIACSPAAIHRGQISCARYRAMPLTEIALSIANSTAFEEQKGYFNYECVPLNSDRVEWYLNFAHADLFCAYGRAVFAQDEMQVAEHPALGALREALLSNDIVPFTVEAGIPTPILIRGVERRCAIATDANPQQDRPLGLYGNNFARATARAIELATTPIDPPTISNIIAMEAPAGGNGSYSYAEIEYILTTAFTGFQAAKIESLLVSSEPIVVIHTGFWGCGAYGGNRILMVLLQLLAARFAGINCLKFHTVDFVGSLALSNGMRILNRDLAIDRADRSIANLLTDIYELDFQWGVSDGN